MWGPAGWHACMMIDGCLAGWLYGGWVGGGGVVGGPPKNT